MIIAHTGKQYSSGFLIRHQEKLFPIIDSSLNAVNYLFHIIVSWFLIPNEYGILNSVLALLSMMIVVGIGVQSVTARYIAKRGCSTHFIYKTMLKTATKLLLISLVVISALLIPLMNLTRASLPVLLVVMGIFSVNVFTSINRGIMQGKRDFLKLNINFILEVFSKITVVIILLNMRANVFLVLIAVLVAMSLSFLHSLYYIKSSNNIYSNDLSDNLSSNPSISEIKKSIAFIIVSSFLVQVFYSFDMVLVNKLLPMRSGIYAVIEKYGQIIYFIALSLSVVLLPKFSSMLDDKAKLRKTIIRGLLITLGIGALLTFAYWLVGAWSVDFIFGEKYSDAGSYLVLSGITFTMLALLFVLINVFVAMNRYGYLWFLLFGSASIILCITLFANNNITQVIYVLLIHFGILALLFAVRVFSITGNNSDNKNTILKKTRQKPVHFLFLSWRDIKNPKKGGAEVFTHELLKRLPVDKYRITHFSPAFDGCIEDENIDNIRYIRRGGLLSVIYHAYKHYKTNKDQYDFVVEQVNTHRFLTKLWVEKTKRIFFIHQLTKEIWFYEFPKILSPIAYLIEYLSLRFQSTDTALTVSESTKQDLIRHGFKDSNVFILPEGIDFTPPARDKLKQKYDKPTFLYVGRFSTYKGIDDAIKSFAKLTNDYPDSRLIIMGKINKSYKEKRLDIIINTASIKDKVVFTGFVSAEEKLDIMGKSHAMLFPSIREGWGLTVLEAGAYGTPSIVYNSPGLVDAVDYGKAGYLCEHKNIDSLYNAMLSVINNKQKYEKIRNNAYEFSIKFNWKHTSEAFQKIFGNKEEI